MYTLIDTFEGDRQPLIELAGRLRLQVNKRGYATSYTEQEKSVALFKPLLGGVFPGEWSFAMLSLVIPEGHIHLHTDGETERDGSQRLHLVLQNNPFCWSYSADAGWQQLQEGGIYTFDPSVEHASVNLGKESRLHFVVDVRNRKGKE